LSSFAKKKIKKLKFQYIFHCLKFQKNYFSHHVYTLFCGNKLVFFCVIYKQENNQLQKFTRKEKAEKKLKRKLFYFFFFCGKSFQTPTHDRMEEAKKKMV
jgi:hypothetical protein